MKNKSYCKKKVKITARFYEYLQGIIMNQGTKNSQIAPILYQLYFRISKRCFVNNLLHKSTENDGIS